MRQFRPKSVTPAPANAHWAVRRLFEEMIRNRCGYQDLEQRSGVGREAIRAWRRRQNPSLQNIEACLNALGLSFRITSEEADGI